MNYLSKQRDQIEVINDVLNGITRGFSITRVTMSLGLNHLHMKRIITLLVNRGFVKSEIRPESMRHCYYVTKDGIDLQDTMRRLRHLLMHGDNNDSNYSSKYDLKRIGEDSQEITLDLIAKKKRSYMEIIFVILSNILDEPRTLSYIANKSYLNQKQAKFYINKLAELEMLTEINKDDKKKYYITQKGIVFLGTYIGIYNLIYRRAI